MSTLHPLAACSSCRPRPPRHSRGRLRGGTRGRTRVRIWRKALRDVEVSGTELLLRDRLPCRGFEYVEALFRSAHGPTSRMPRPSTRGKDPVGFAFRFTRNSPPSSTPSPPSPSPLVYSPAVAVGSTQGPAVRDKAGQGPWPSPCRRSGATYMGHLVLVRWV